MIARVKNLISPSPRLRNDAFVVCGCLYHDSSTFILQDHREPHAQIRILDPEMSMLSVGTICPKCGGPQTCTHVHILGQLNDDASAIGTVNQLNSYLDHEWREWDNPTNHISRLSRLQSEIIESIKVPDLSLVWGTICQRVNECVTTLQIDDATQSLYELDLVDQKDITTPTFSVEPGTRYPKYDPNILRWNGGVIGKIRPSTDAAEGVVGVIAQIETFVADSGDFYDRSLYLWHKQRTGRKSSGHRMIDCPFNQ